MCARDPSVERPTLADSPPRPRKERVNRRCLSTASRFALLQGTWPKAVLCCMARRSSPAGLPSATSGLQGPTLRDWPVATTCHTPVAGLSISACRVCGARAPNSGHGPARETAHLLNFAVRFLSRGIFPAPSRFGELPVGGRHGFSLCQRLSLSDRGHLLQIRTGPWGLKEGKKGGTRLAAAQVENGSRHSNWLGVLRSMHPVALDRWAGGRKRVRGLDPPAAAAAAGTTSSLQQRQRQSCAASVGVG
jgi:hypothetical protein